MTVQIKTIEEFFHMLHVLFITYPVQLGTNVYSHVDEPWRLAIRVKAIEQHFSAMPFVFQ